MIMEFVLFCTVGELSNNLPAGQSFKSVLEGPWKDTWWENYYQTRIATSIFTISILEEVI